MLLAYWSICNYFLVLSRNTDINAKNLIMNMESLVITFKSEQLDFELKTYAFDLTMQKALFYEKLLTFNISVPFLDACYHSNDCQIFRAIWRFYECFQFYHKFPIIDFCYQIFHSNSKLWMINIVNFTIICIINM